MFSIAQKRLIASKVQEILKETNHPELPSGEIHFSLHVDGAEAWSWADIRNNGAITDISNANPWNEVAQSAAESRAKQPDALRDRRASLFSELYALMSIIEAEERKAKGRPNNNERDLDSSCGGEEG